MPLHIEQLLIAKIKKKFLLYIYLSVYALTGQIIYYNCLVSYNILVALLLKALMSFFHHKCAVFGEYYLMSKKWGNK